LKIDSCCGSQDHATAFSDYAKFRDAMNASGTHVWFSLCGWEEWYAPPDPSLNYTGGASLGNSWRIAGDGSGWGPLTNCMNTIAAVYNASGPGGWSDPDLLIGPEVYVGGQSDEQARAQFTMWSLFPANLIISQNVLTWSPYALETYSNAEAIAINQDPLGSPASRIVGGDLPFPCSSGGDGALANVVAEPCDPSDPAQKWSYDAATGAVSSGLFANVSGVLDAVECGTADGTPVAVYPPDNGSGTCGGKNQAWRAGAGGTLVNGNSGSCLDVYDFAGPAVDTWGCNGGVNQNFTFTAWGGLSTAASTQYPAMCLAARAAPPQACTNVWGRTLSDGWALGFVNNGGAPATVACDSSCFAALGIPASVSGLAVRDVWAHAVVAHLTPPWSFAAPVNASGFAALFKLTAE
jgi:alpha-galactosidase